MITRGRSLVWVIGVVAALLALRLSHRLAAGPPLPHLGTVPAFALTDQTGRSISDGDLRGKVWIANFIFTSCAGVCPMLTRRMADLDRRLAAVEPARLHLVSFSVDPARDTPARLAEYARPLGADAARWSFLTGAVDAIEKAVIAGFKIGISHERPEGGGETAGDDGNGLTLLHGSHFVLVDADGVIRGYYPPDEEGLPRLAADATRLVGRGGR